MPSAASPCVLCQRFVDGMARVSRTLRDQNKLLEGLFDALGKRPDVVVTVNNVKTKVRQLQFVFGKIQEFAADDGIRGLRELFDLMKPANQGKNIAGIFRDSIWKKLPASQTIEELLADFHEIVVGLGGDTGARNAKMTILADAMTGQNGVKGQWYVQKFVKSKAVGSIANIEEFEILKAGQRGVDVKLKQAINGARFFECKSSATFKVDQALSHVESLGEKEFAELRFVINYQKEADEAAALTKDATNLIDNVIKKKVAQERTATEKAIRKAVESASGVTLPSWGDSITFLPPADQAKVLDAVKKMFFLPFNVDIPIP